MAILLTGAESTAVDECGICQQLDPDGRCVNDADGTACEDGDLCTIGDTCAEGTCVGGAPEIAMTAMTAPTIAAIQLRMRK